MKPKQPASEHDPPTLLPVRIVDPNAVYLADEFRALFRLRMSTIRREVREGRLRISKRAGRYFLLGEWILEWVRTGEIRRRNSQESELAPSNGTQERN